MVGVGVLWEVDQCAVRCGPWTVRGARTACVVEQGCACAGPNTDGAFDDTCLVPQTLLQEGVKGHGAAFNKKGSDLPTLKRCEHELQYIVRITDKYQLFHR